MAGNPMARFGRPGKNGKGAGNPLFPFATPEKPASGKGNPLFGYGTGKPAPRRSSGKKATAAAPVSAAAQAKADRAKASAKRYAEVQRAANKAKRAVLSRRGPQDLAGRVQRDMDLKRMRELQKGAESWKKKAKGQGIRFGGDTPRGNPPASGGSSSGSGSGSGSTGTRTSGGGGASAASSVARATSGGAAKPSSAPKVGRVLKNARAQREQTTGVPITAKELAAFMKRYDATHKGTLSRSDAVLMARLIKQRGGKLAKSYGLNVAQEN